MKKTRMLKKNYEFRAVFSKGTYHSGKYIEAFIKRENKNCNFLGIAISTKVGKAVQRNKIKRLIRECYSEVECFIKPGYSVVILWKKKIDIKNALYSNIKIDIKYIFEKARIFEEKI